MWKSKTLLLGICLAFWCCRSEEKQPLANPTQIQAYFPLSQFVKEQIQLLEGREVQKELVFNEQRETIQQRLDVEGWRSELDWFVQMDINKASLATAYEVKEDGDLTIYQLKPGEKSALKEMIVRHEGEHVREVILFASESNTFYESHTEGKLSTNANTGLLENYQVSSSQSAWFRNPNTMEVKGVLLN